MDFEITSVEFKHSNELYMVESREHKASSKIYKSSKLHNVW